MHATQSKTNNTSTLVFVLCAKLKMTQQTSLVPKAMNQRYTALVWSNFIQELFSIEDGNAWM